jgi:hypothetical protein
MWLIGLYSHPARIIWIPEKEALYSEDVLQTAAAIICDEGLLVKEIRRIIPGVPVIELQFELNIHSIQHIRNLILAPRSIAFSW